MHRRKISILMAGLMAFSAFVPVSAFASAPVKLEEKVDPVVSASEAQESRGIEEGEAIDTPVQSSDTPVGIAEAIPVSEDAMAQEAYDPETDPAPIGIANVAVSVDVSRDFSLASVTKNSNLYGEDKKTVLFTLGKGDSLLIRDEPVDSKWTAVLIVGNEGDHLAYVLTSRLSKNKKKQIKTRDISKYSQYCVAADANKSYGVYAKPSAKSQKIGVLRKAIVLPVVQTGDKYSAVLLQGGIGYIRNDHLVILDNYHNDGEAPTPVPVEEAIG